MKLLTETKAVDELTKLKKAYREFIGANYEHKAKSCLTCQTQGACCLDAHFVNVNITRLEAAAIRNALAKLNEEKQREIYRRALETVEKYDLKTSGDTFAKTFACPLFEKGLGCLVHENGKPAPCIAHACYENKADLPPETIEEQAELRIEKLNKRTYGNAWAWLPLPVWMSLINPFAENSDNDR